MPPQLCRETYGNPQISHNVAYLFCIWELVVEMFLVDNWILQVSWSSQADGIFIESSDIFLGFPLLSCGFLEALKNIYYAVIRVPQMRSPQSGLHDVSHSSPLVVGDHEAERLLHSKCRMRLEAWHQSHHVLSKGKRCCWGCSSQVPVPSDKAMLFPGQAKNRHPHS